MMFFAALVVHFLTDWISIEDLLINQYYQSHYIPGFLEQTPDQQNTYFCILFISLCFFWLLWWSGLVSRNGNMWSSKAWKNTKRCCIVRPKNDFRNQQIVSTRRTWWISGYAFYLYYEILYSGEDLAYPVILNVHANKPVGSPLLLILFKSAKLVFVPSPSVASLSLRKNPPSPPPLWLKPKLWFRLIASLLSCRLMGK